MIKNDHHINSVEMKKGTFHIYPFLNLLLRRQMSRLIAQYILVSYNIRYIHILYGNLIGYKDEKGRRDEEMKLGKRMLSGKSGLINMRNRAIVQVDDKAE